MRKMKVWAFVFATVSAATLGAACGDSGSGEDSSGSGSTFSCEGVACDNVPTFTAGLNWDKCTTCHAADQATRDAAKVPGSSDYTSYPAVQQRAELIAERVNTTGGQAMPPSGSPGLSDAERSAFTTWGCCGAPE